MSTGLLFRPQRQHKQTLLFLHGYDSSAQDYNSWGPLLSGYKNLKLVLPAAEFEAVWYGETGRSWYHFSLDDQGYQEDSPEKQSLETSVARLNSLVEAEVRSVGPENVFLGGSSQGCGMAFHVFAGFHTPLGGFLGMRGMILDATPLPGNLLSGGGTVSFSYGSEDSVIVPERIRASLRRLPDIITVMQRIYPHVGHDLDEREDEAVQSFLEIALA